jgi:hypothetical protein
MSTILSDTEMLDALDPFVREFDEERHRERNWNQLMPLLAVASLGVLVVAISFAVARAEGAAAPELFWGGLLMLVAPVSYRLFGGEAGYTERLGLVLALGLGLYAVKVMYSPSGFTLHDELGQVRSTEEVLRTGKLYATNPIVETYGYFPGIQVAAAALASISGMSIFAAGTVLIGVMRVVVMIGIFAFLARVTRSERVAGIGAIIYAANPNFLYFDSQFSYESLAVPLAAVCLLTTAMADRPGRGRGAAVGLAIVLAAGVVVTHHMTSYALLGALTIWATAAAFRRRPWAPVAIVAAATAAMTGAWLLVAGGAVWTELWPVLRGAGEGFWQIVSGSSQAKAPFTAAKGHTDPTYIRALGVASVVCLLGALPWGIWATWRERARHPALIMLGLVALAYPASLALRLSLAGTETSNRASEFLFLGLGAVIGLAYLRWLREPIDGGPRGRSIRLALTGLLCVTVLGGITVGTSSTALMPGPYRVAADSRSITPENVAAARWARTHLPFDSRLLTDSSNKALMAAYGLQDPQGGSSLGRQVAAIFSARELGPGVMRMIAYDHLEYLVIDTRLASELPRSGHYFDSGESKSPVEPLRLEALQKFSHTRQIDKIYSSGDIRIYSAKPLLGGGESP